MWRRRRARSLDGVNMQPHIRSNLVVIGLALASLAVAAPSPAGQVRHRSEACYGSAWHARAGGISELISCGSHGVSGTRAQFVKAVTRPVYRPFLWQLPH
jgi:hypothetical protein